MNELSSAPSSACAEPIKTVQELVFEHRPGAVLALADGTVFEGVAIGAAGETTGEVVFNTAITGYQEILSDPSYSRQLVTLTYPHIGNVGANAEDVESGRIHAAGLIIRDCPDFYSSFRGTTSLSAYLRSEGIVAIADVDTRHLTTILRDGGSQSGAIVVGRGSAAEARALQLARSCPAMAGLDLAREVSTTVPYSWNEGPWQLGTSYVDAAERTPAAHTLHVVAYDFGVKRNILRLLVGLGCRVTVVPATMPAKEVVALRPDGIFLSNGPGDPEPCDYAVAATRTLIESGLPTFGICLGHQIMGLASGARTMKMKFGHHGANHPVLELGSGRVFITSQNHGFAVDPATLPPRCEVTHISLFDGSLQGFRYTDRPAFCFQGHPEASPGPHDVDGLFHRYLKLMQDNRLEMRP